MNEQWQHAVRKRRINFVLHCAHRSQNDWVNGFEVTWVCRELNWQLRSIWRNKRAHRTKVILHVARALHRRWVDVALELLEDLVVALAHDIAEHVQTTAVSHAQYRTVHTCIGGTGEDGVENWNCRLCPIEAETLGSYVLCGQETLECFGSVQTLEYTALVDSEIENSVTFNALLNPALFIGGVNVHVLNANGAAICVAQNTKQIAKG